MNLDRIGDTHPIMLHLLFFHQFLWLDEDHVFYGVHLESQRLFELEILQVHLSFMSIIINCLHASYAFEGLGYHCDEKVLQNNYLDDALDYPHDPDEVDKDLVVET